MTTSRFDIPIHIISEPGDLILKKKQVEILYDFLKHEYIPYENLEMLALMKLIRQFLDENQ